MTLTITRKYTVTRNLGPMYAVTTEQIIDGTLGETVWKGCTAGWKTLIAGLTLHEANLYVRGLLDAGVIASEASRTNERALLAKVKRILDGIDRDSTDDEDGWWETSRGVEFGRQILEEIDRAFS